ncbi:MAG: hypothetical protein JWM91_615 [Rhodospirillales bacterium]|nr:hypothetical protein [Rhodospirillales bacterium]
MVATQTCLISVSGVTISHFVRLGWSSGFAAQILGLQALVRAVATGICGWMTKRYDPKAMLVPGLVAEGLGIVLLAFHRNGWSAYAFIPVYGVGWSGRASPSPCF